MTTEQITSLKGTARLTGVLMIALAIAAGYGIMYVPETLASAGDNIGEYQGLLRAGIAANAVVFLVEIAIVALLYKLLEPVNRNISLMGAYARMAMTVVQSVNVFNLIFMLLLVSGSNFGAVFDPAQISALTSLFLETFGIGALVWGWFFGLHLVLSGYLVYKSGYLPKFIGILLIIISAAYFIQSFGTFLLPQYTETFEMIGLMATIEMVFPLWLIVKGVKDPT
jgi:hypothetical protein